MPEHPIRFGIQTGQQLVQWPQMLDLWQKADRWGYDSLWNFDHFYPIFVDPNGPCLEAWTTLAALAQATSRARIGTLVNGNTYRHPAITAKMAVTLDHVSGGRFTLGLGAGWFELEHEAFGIDFMTVPQRLAALDEACRIVKGLFTLEKTTVRGKHYAVTEALGLPKPVQRPHPPIMIGGVGEQVLLRIVAEHADLWNTGAHAERMKHLIEVIDRHGVAAGRDTSTIEKSVLMPLCYRASKERERLVTNLIAGMEQGTPEKARRRIMIGGEEECFDTIERYRKVGVTHFIFMTFTPYNEDEIQRFAEEVIPAARRG